MQALAIVNGCPEGVSVTNPRTRLGAPAFTFDASLPATLRTGEETSIGVTFTPVAGAPEAEDVFFVDVGSDPASAVRYPITLFGSAD